MTHKYKNIIKIAFKLTDIKFVYLNFRLKTKKKYNNMQTPKSCDS